MIETKPTYHSLYEYSRNVLDMLSAVAAVEGVVGYVGGVVVGVSDCQYSVPQHQHLFLPRHQRLEWPSLARTCFVGSRLPAAVKSNRG